MKSRKRHSDGEPHAPGGLEDLGVLSIVAVDIGNSTVGIGRWVEGEVLDVERVATGDRDAIIAALDAVRGKCENTERQAIVIASVVPAETAWLKTHIDEGLGLRPFVIGENTPLPIDVDVREPSAVGVDRVCAAAAAFSRTGHACTVVDIGSAVTVDVIDDEGVFRGGAIFAGMKLQAQALSDHTASLPLVELSLPQSPVGKDTVEAIRSGLSLGMVGAIRNIVESFATEFNRWAQVVVTGGGAATLLDKLDFVDSVVPDLCLMGVGLAYMRRVRESQGV